jgi:uncharacterized protein involved in cysteine biosynthesis
MKTELRKFGFIWAFIFAVAAFLPLLKHHEIKLWAVYVSLSFVIISIFYPQIYQTSRFYPNWIKFGGLIGKINSKIIIAAMFYLLFFPISVIIKISGKDLLNKKIDKTKESYFIEENSQLKDMKNQF